MNKKRALTIIPSVPCWKVNDKIYFDRKFYDGVIQYTKYWPGQIKCIMKITNNDLPDFGLVEYNQDICPFELYCLALNEMLTENSFVGTDIILASADSLNYENLEKLSGQLKIKLVYVLEYILETRYQIVKLANKNIFLRMRRLFYVFRKEGKRLKALKNSDGLQANGVPAYDFYKTYTHHALLYLDSRMNGKDYITEQQLLARLNRLKSKSTLNLSFSGRLNAMKGADHLIKLANILNEKNIDFILTIYGDGNLKESMVEEIKIKNLQDCVNIKGAVPFYEELVPYIKLNTDIFICCHRQSDPSCSYLETLSCGVPIVGYDNKAFKGILKLSKVGWDVPMNNINMMADKIIYLNNNRDEIVRKSNAALVFSKEHSFEKTFKRRIEHLQNIVEQQNIYATP